MKSREIIPWICVGVLVVLLVWSLGTKGEKPVVIEKRTTDTLVQTVHDTTVLEKIAYKEKRVVDTTYIVVRDSIFVPVPISEYRFKEDGLFDITARGFDVSLSNVTVYPKTEYRTITETKETTITKYKSSLFVFGGFSVISDTFSPKIGVGLSLSGKWLISGDISLYQKQPIYSCSVGYNILNK